MITPLSKHVILALDPIPEASAILHTAEMDTIKYCKRCDAMMEALNAPCKRPKEHWGWDKKTGRRPVYEGTSRAHEIETVEAPASPMRTRTGVVIAMNKVPGVSIGMRVLIDAVAGADPFDENDYFTKTKRTQYRVVHEDAILGEVELD